MTQPYQVVAGLDIHKKFIIAILLWADGTKIQLYSPIPFDPLYIKNRRSNLIPFFVKNAPFPYNGYEAARRVKQMVEIKDILDYYENYGSYKAVARRLDISVNTVKKYVHLQARMQDGTLPAFLAADPKVKQPPRVLTDEVKEKIHGYLASSERNHGKQRITAKRILQLLAAEGIPIGYTTVKEEVRRWKQDNAPREVAVRQQPPEGWRAEFDFASVVLMIGRDESQFALGGMVLPHSLYRFGRLFPHAGHLEVVQTHIDFFNAIRAVPQTIFYDRLGVVYNARTKQVNDNFLRFAVHYGFEPHLCNPAAPQEKGTDEESVGYIRRYAFGDRDQFDSFEEASQWLAARITEINHLPASRRTLPPIQALALERDHMHPLPSLDYSNYELRRAVIDRYSMVHYEKTAYSVPDTYRGRTITLQVFVDTINLVDGTRVIATHPRKPHCQNPVADIHHFLTILHRKPGALAHAEVFHQCDPQILNLFTKQYRSNPKEFLPLLDLIQDTSEEAFCGALALLTRENIPITYDTLRFFLFQNPVQMVEPFDGSAAFAVPEPDLADYDRLIQRVAQ